MTTYLERLELSASAHAARIVATYRGGVWRVLLDGHHIHGYCEGETLEAACLLLWEGARTQRAACSTCVLCDGAA